MVQDAQTHADEDKRRREEVEVRNTAESVAYQVERQLNELGDRAPANEKARATQLITETRELVKNNTSDLSRLRQLTSDLQQIASAISSAAYSQTTQAGAGDGRGTRTESTANQDVVDAEFKEV